MKLESYKINDEKKVRTTDTVLGLNYESIGSLMTKYGDEEEENLGESFKKEQKKIKIRNR